MGDDGILLYSELTIASSDAAGASICKKNPDLEAGVLLEQALTSSGCCRGGVCPSPR